MNENQYLLPRKVDVENQSQYLLEKINMGSEGQYSQTGEQGIEFIVLKGLEGNPSPELNPMQQFFSEYLLVIQIFWWVVWVGVLVVMLYKLFR